MCDPKEPMFFCTDFHKESDRFHRRSKMFPFRTEKQYFSLFKKAKDERIIGESSTMYLDSKVAAKKIHSFNPEAKLIIMLREPVEYLYSLHSQFVYTENENIEDFKKAMLAQTARKRKNQYPRFCKVPSWLHYDGMVRYAEQIKRFTSCFPKKNIMIIFFDDFRKDNLKVYKQVLRFLEVDEKFTPSFDLLNANKKVRFRRLKRIADRPVVWRLPKKILPGKVYGRLKSITYKVLIKRAPRRPLDQAFRLRLMRKYQPEVVKLSKLLKKDLVKKWGYDKL